MSVISRVKFLLKEQFLQCDYSYIEEFCLGPKDICDLQEIHKQYVLSPVDKISQGITIWCIKGYLQSASKPFTSVVTYLYQYTQRGGRGWLFRKSRNFWKGKDKDLCRRNLNKLPVHKVRVKFHKNLCYQHFSVYHLQSILVSI